jgi:hypothetical protein
MWWNFNLKEDPWNIEDLFIKIIKNYQKSELVKFFVHFANKHLKCKKMLDLGSEIGYLLNYLKNNLKK